MVAYDLNEPVNILIGDCRKVLQSLPAKSVHCAVSSPPYWGLRDYGVGGQIGLEKSLRDFYSAMADVFIELWRVLRDDGTCWINMGDTYRQGELLGVPWGLIEFIRQSVMFCPKCDSPRNQSCAVDRWIKWECLDCGFTASPDKYKRWRLRADIIWHKPNPMPEPDRGRPTNAHEYLFLLTKGKKYFYDAEAIKEEATKGHCGSRFDQGKTATHQNNSMSTAERVDDGMRNKRSVWTIATFPFKEAHFATFPPDLVEPCIKAGTSAHGACSECGRPWLRVTQASAEYQERLGSSWHDHKDDLGKGQRGCPAAFRGAPMRVTVGWKPQCECNAEVVPCVVLDPFNGSGTTGVVARRLMRHYVGIELNPEYAEMARRRIEGDQPLFNRVAVG